MTIEKALVASTGNIRESTNELLARLANAIGTEGQPVVYAKGEYGWWIHVWPGHYGAAPYELRGLLDKAASCQCLWLMLDRDADPLDNFPQWEW